MGLLKPDLYHRCREHFPINIAQGLSRGKPQFMVSVYLQTVREIFMSCLVTTTRNPSRSLLSLGIFLEVSVDNRL